VPDILTVAKAFGGGLPIGAIYFKQDHHDFLSHDPAWDISPPLVEIRFARFGLQPSGNRRGKIIEQGRKGELFERLLRHSRILEIRRIGLMIAVDFDSAGGSTELLNTPGRWRHLLLVHSPFPKAFALLHPLPYRAGIPDRLRSDFESD